MIHPASAHGHARNVVMPKPQQVRFGDTAVKVEEKVETAVATPVAAKSKVSKVRLAHVMALWTALAGSIGLQVHNNGATQAALTNNSAQIQQVAEANKATLGQINSLNGSINAINGTVSGLNSDLSKVIAERASANVMVRGQYGLGSGTWLKDANGNLYILTNHHVVDDNSLPKGFDDPARFEVTLYNGSDIKDQTVIKAQVANVKGGQALSADHDMALLEVITPNFRLPSHIKPLTLRDINKDPLKVGERVFTVGSPHGMRDQVTSGTITHIERHHNDFEPENIFIGIDAPINPGNSGGALYDSQGRLIGINTAGIRGADGTGMAIRTDIINKMLETWGVIAPKGF